MVTDSLPLSPSSAWAMGELGKISSGDHPLGEVLSRTAQLAKEVIFPILVEVSITLIDNDGATTPTYTGALALELDKAQYVLGQGPCLASAEAGQVVSIPDMAHEVRWPVFAKDAFAKGVRSTLSVPLPVQRQVIGALNIYAFEPSAFTDEIADQAEKFCGYAAVAITNTTLYMSTAKLANQMQQAMESRAVIEQAKGILMGQRRCDEQAAFDLLVKLSQQSNRKLRHVASALVEQTLSR
jgi:GAF domain-containing protein